MRQEQLQRLREEGSCYVAAVISPGVPLEERLSAFVDRLAKGRLHYLEEAEQYRSFIRQDGLTTQQLSQRTGRVTCSGTLSKKASRLGILSLTISVGW